MDKYVSQWLERSNYDLETAKAMLDARRYLYVAYMRTMIEALAFTEKEYQKIDQRCLLARIVKTGKKYKTVQ